MEDRGAAWLSLPGSQRPDPGIELHAELLDRVANTTTANRDTWLTTMS